MSEAWITHKFASPKSCLWAQGVDTIAERWVVNCYTRVSSFSPCSYFLEYIIAIVGRESSPCSLEVSEPWQSYMNRNLILGYNTWWLKQTLECLSTIPCCRHQLRSISYQWFYFLHKSWVVHRAVSVVWNLSLPSDSISAKERGKWYHSLSGHLHFCLCLPATTFFLHGLNQFSPYNALTYNIP